MQIIRFKQIVPASGAVAPVSIRGSLSQILAHPNVNKWTLDRHFTKFCYTTREGHSLWSAALVVERDNQHDATILGFLDQIPVGLDKWTPHH